jgi:hypothetical protein
MKKFLVANQAGYSCAKEGSPTVCCAYAGFISEGAFDSPDWIFETKLDGYRAIAVIDSTGKAQIVGIKIVAESAFDGIKT